MIVNEIHSKTILSVSKIYDYVINPYTGCQHACTYCYARFMKRFTGHTEPWGEFVDVKVNAAELLEKEIKRKKRGRVWISGVCDPYQPLEEKLGLTDWNRLIASPCAICAFAVQVSTAKGQETQRRSRAKTSSMPSSWIIQLALNSSRTYFIWRWFKIQSNLL